jgi:alpha-L-fucosidase
MQKKHLQLLLFFMALFPLQAQSKMDWFEDAKLGIFIHWGLYSVDGISESWAFYNGYLSHEDYLKQRHGFGAENYNPDQWADLIAQSGAKYTVITSKHHEGFALWKTKYGNLNAVKSAKAQRDVLTPFVKAVRAKGLQLGIYFSLPDWSYSDYTHFTNSKKRYQISDAPKRWDKYLKYMNGQLDELAKNYTPDLWWFDGDWEHSAEEWNVEGIKARLTKNNPQTIFNSRLNGNGDYETPEIGVPVSRPDAEHWELCVTMNDSWGYQENDTNYKTPLQVIDLLVDCISKGGNLLLDIGPKADGTIPVEQQHILKELGKWTSKHSSAIYGTRRGIPYEHFYGPTALSKDKKILYLYVRDIPKDGKIVLKGISNRINSAYVVGQGTLLQQQTLCKVYWNKYPGITYIEIPNDTLDPYYTVIALNLDGAIDLFGTETGAIEQN